MEVRKYVTVLEEIHSEGGRTMDPPGKRAAAIAVIKNPFAGDYVEDLTPLMDVGDELGGILGKMAVDALGIAPEKAESYGKAAIVGENGEREHAAAILHPKLGKPFRDAVSGGKSLIPSAKKVGGMGSSRVYASAGVCSLSSLSSRAPAYLVKTSTSTYASSL